MYWSSAVFGGVAVAAADAVLIPLEADKFSIEGLKRLLDVIEGMRAINGRLAIEGVLISLSNGRRAIEQTFAEALGACPYEEVVHRDNLAVIV